MITCGLKFCTVSLLIKIVSGFNAWFAGFWWAVEQVSDFGRTLTSNGIGTDHAWGGNHIIMGGAVRGGQIHGQFPDTLTSDGDLIISRGRVIPTTPWCVPSTHRVVSSRGLLATLSAAYDSLQMYCGLYPSFYLYRGVCMHTQGRHVVRYRSVAGCAFGEHDDCAA